MPIAPENRQNNAYLESLSQKTNALKSVTINIYDNARNHETIDNTVRTLSPPPVLVMSFEGEFTRANHARAHSIRAKCFPLYPQISKAALDD